MPATSAVHRQSTSKTGLVKPPADGWGVVFCACDGVMVIFISAQSERCNQSCQIVNVCNTFHLDQSDLYVYKPKAKRKLMNFNFLESKCF